MGSSAMGDVDNDGDLDLVITGSPGGNIQTILYKNDGWIILAKPMLVRNSSSSFSDVDGDGDLDLVIAGRVPSSFEAKANLYKNDGNGKFSESSAGLIGVGKSSTSFADVDNDDDLDLLITSGDQDEDSTSNLFLNDGSGNFSEVKAGLPGSNGGSSLFSDLDNNGDLDLLINATGGTFIYLNTKIK